MVVLACLLSLFGCRPGSRVTADDTIVKFSYKRDGGMRYDAGFSYMVKRTDDGKAHFIFDERLPKEKEFTIDDLSVFDSLQKIILKHKMYRYSGFYHPMAKIKDGKTWYLTVDYASGKSIEAHGYMHGPRGYHEAFDEVTACLDQWKKMPGDPKADSMVSFYLVWSRGMTENGGFRYEIDSDKNGRVHFRINEGYPDEKEFYTDDHSVFDSLDKIVRKYNMMDYASDYYPDLEVTDGQSWTLSIRYASKRSVHSDGYIVVPDGYREAEKEIHECLRPWKELPVAVDGLTSFDYAYGTMRFHAEPQDNHTLVTIDDEASNRHEKMEKPLAMLEDLRVTSITEHLKENGNHQCDDPERVPFKFELTYSNGDHYLYESCDLKGGCHKTDVMRWFFDRWDLKISE